MKLTKRGCQVFAANVTPRSSQSHTQGSCSNVGTLLAHLGKEWCANTSPETGVSTCANSGPERGVGTLLAQSHRMGGGNDGFFCLRSRENAKGRHIGPDVYLDPRCKVFGSMIWIFF